MLEKLKVLIENTPLDELQKNWNSLTSHKFSNGLVLTTEDNFKLQQTITGDVSFDFDSTLERKDVQEFAIRLKQMGYNIWITTTRHLDSPIINMDMSESNNDLYKVAMSIGIPHSNIIFTNGEDKEFSVFTGNFKFHLDDCDWEIMEINKTSNIGVHLSANWEEICLGLCRI